MKKTFVKKSVAWLLTLVMVIGFTPVTGFAAGDGGSDRGSGVTVLAFTSDTHNTQNNESANRLSDFIDAVEDEYGEIEVLGIGGDLSDTHNIQLGQQTGSGSTQPALYWSNSQEVMDAAESDVEKVVYTTGNHEYENGQFGTYTGAQDTQSAYKMNQVAETGDNYVVYALGSQSSTNSYPTDWISNLQTELTKTQYDGKTIIVLSHYPLHYISSRTIGNADLLIDALNAVADASDDRNVIFLWGHNHSQTNSSEQNYDKIREPGYSIAYKSGSSKTTKFYYAAAGCMCDGDYNSSNNSNAAGNVKGKGIVVEINSRNQIELQYYDKSGSKLTTSGASFSNQTGDPVAATGVAIDKSNPNPVVNVGKTVQLSANLQPEGATADVKWSSNRPDVATVDSKGLVTGVGAGTATITASIDTDSGAKAVVGDSISVEVKAAPAKKTVYVRTNTMQSGGTYLIVGRNTAGSSNALSHNNSSLALDGVTVHDASEIDSQDVTDVWIDEDDVDAASLWEMTTVTVNNRQYDKLINGGYYISSSGSGGNYSLTFTSTSNYDANNTNYSGSGNYLQLANRRYIQYRNDTFSIVNSAPTTYTVYIYQPVQVCDHVYTCPGMEWHVSESAESATATATFTCTICERSTEVPATVSIKSETTPTCEKPAERTFTATAADPNGVAFTEDKTVTQQVLVDEPGTSTTTIYVPATSISTDKTYVLVNSDQVGSVHAIANGYPNAYSGQSGYGNGYDPRDAVVEIQEGTITPVSGTAYQTKYIAITNEDDAEDAVWSPSIVEGEGTYFSNGG